MIFDDELIIDLDEEDHPIYYSTLLYLAYIFESMLRRILFSKEVDLPYNAKNSRWYFRITAEGYVLKIANLHTKSLIQVDRLADIDLLTAQQLEESEECSSEEIELQIEMAKVNAIPVFFSNGDAPQQQHISAAKYTSDVVHSRQHLYFIF